MSLPVLAEVVRSGFVESVHRGSLVVLDADGSVASRLGTPDEPILPRSANKPLQASRDARLGLEPGRRAARRCRPRRTRARTATSTACAAILAAAGLQEEDLQCPADVPVRTAGRALAWARAGRGPERVAMNCSGKHAAMLATCVVSGWPTETYLDPDHPLQAGCFATSRPGAGEPVAVDGGRRVRRAAVRADPDRAGPRRPLAGGGRADGAGRQVADAMRAFPEWVGGTGRDVTALMAGVPGLLVKDGAEAVYVAATADGHCVALKIDDGAARACVPVLVGALRGIGLEAAVLDELAETPVFGGGRHVGVVRVPSGLF